MRVDVKGKVSEDPRQAILAIEAVTRTLCERSGKDPAEGVMMLLTAAAHLSNTYSRNPGGSSHMEALARALGAATIAAGDMFQLRKVPEASNDG